MLAKLFDTLGNMGIWIRFNDKRTEPPREEGRIWGEPVGGFAISLAARDGDGISILIKNLGEKEVRAQVLPWLHFFQVNIEAPLKAYGRQALKVPNLAKPVERVFPPGKYLSTDTPIPALYELKPGIPYRVSVTCPAPGQPDLPALVSNEITLSVGPA